MSNLTLLRTSKLFQLTSLSVALTLVGCGGGTDAIAPKPDLGVISDSNSGGSGSKQIKDVDVYISFANNELKTGKDKTTAQIRITDKNGGILSGIPVELGIEDAAKYGLSLSKPSKQTTDANGMVEIDIIQSDTSLDAQVNHETKFQVIVSDLKGTKIAEQSMPIVVTGTQVEGVTASTGLLGPADSISLEGKVVDSVNQPLKNATIVLYNNDKVIDTRKTDNQGKFIFDTNSSLLTAVKDNYVFSVEIQGSEGVSQHIPKIIEIPSISSVNINFPKVPDILLNTFKEVVVTVPNAKTGDVVTISTNKGQIYTDTKGQNGSTNQKLKVNNRQIVFYIKSEVSGTATITAKYGQDQKEANIYFVTANPHTLLLQVERAVLTTNETTSVIAKVLDNTHSPVKNAVVNFSVINDASGGKLSKGGLAYTDENGIAMVEYTSGSNPTGADGVRIQAEVNAVRLPNGQDKTVNTLADSKDLSVSTRSSYVSIALADKVSSSSNNIFYIRQGSIIVLDNVGQPAANQQVTLSLIPNDYGRGFFSVEEVLIPQGNNGGNNSNADTTPTTPQTKSEWVKHSVVCKNEDENKNGILDKGEDKNGNNKLDPINTATILRSGQEDSATSVSNGTKQVSFTTDNTGKVDFAIRYPKQYAQWFDAIVTVNTKVDGSESQNSRPISFPVLVDDVSVDPEIRPNAVSPFGKTLSCTAP